MTKEKDILPQVGVALATEERILTALDDELDNLKTKFLNTAFAIRRALEAFRKDPGNRGARFALQSFLNRYRVLAQRLESLLDEPGEASSKMEG